MKTFTLTFLLNLAALLVIAQNHRAYQIDLGVGMNNQKFFNSDHAQGLNFNAGIRYQHSAFEIGLRYEQVFTTLGVDGHGDRYRNFFFRKRDSEFSNFKSIQILLNFTPEFEFFKPIFGVGFARNFFENKQYFFEDYYRPIEPPYNEPTIEKRDYYSVLLHLGYKFKNIRYSVFVHPKIDKRNRFFGTSISYTLGFGKEAELSEYVLGFEFDEKVKPVFLSFEIGRSIVLPVFDHYATASALFLSTQLSVGKNLFLGFAYERKGKEMGSDKNTAVHAYNDQPHSYFVRNTNVGSKISSLKTYLQKTIDCGDNMDILLGAGLARYRIETVGRESAFGKAIPYVFFETQKFGLFLQTGIRTGIFSNKLEFNFPFAGIPKYIGLQTALALQFRRKNAKGPKVQYFENKTVE